MGPAPGVELLMGIIREFHEKCAKIRWQKSLNYVNGLFLGCKWAYNGPVEAD